MPGTPTPGMMTLMELRKRETLTSSSPRVLRGGSFYDNRRFARGAFRVRNDPDDQSRYYGFRLVVSLL